MFLLVNSGARFLHPQVLLCVSGRHEHVFVERWRKASKCVLKDSRKGFNTMVILGAWLLWKHFNACVFEGAPPCMHNLARPLKMSVTSGA
jgi:hypothetical protein